MTDDVVFFEVDCSEFKEKEIRKKNVPEKIQKKLASKPKLRTKEEWDKIYQFYPTTEDGFMKSYQPHEKEEFTAALNKYGFVVIKVFDDGQCDRTVPEFFMDITRRTAATGRTDCSPLDPNDPMSWQNKNWPCPDKKFLTNAPAFTKQAFLNRTDPVIFDIYSHLYKTKDLWCSIDNWGFFRGTKNLKWKDEDGHVFYKDMDEWRHNLKLHWDYNPFMMFKWENAGDPPMYQSLVALVDCPLEVGSFSCVPCSTAFLRTWTSERPTQLPNNQSMRVPEKDPMQNYIQKVPLRKGEMVLWDSKQAHNNFPNRSDKIRLIQFIRMMPATQKRQEKDRYAPKRIIRSHFDDPFIDWKKDLDYLTPERRKLCALDDPHIFNFNVQKKAKKDDETMFKIKNVNQ